MYIQLLLANDLRRFFLLMNIFLIFNNRKTTEFKEFYDEKKTKNFVKAIDHRVSIDC